MLTHSHKIIEKILSSSLINDSPTQSHSEHNDQQEPIEMVIELDANTSATIQIHSYDDPLTLAKSFCFQYSIDPRVINTLANNIKNVKNLEFNQQPSTQKNIHQTQNNENKQYNSMADKQNHSSFMNAYQSIDDSFNRGHSTSKYKTLDKSSNMKNDTTLISNNDLSRRSVFDRLYQNSKSKKTSRNVLDQSTNKNKKISQSFLQASHISSDPCLLIYEKNTKAHQSALFKREQIKKQNQQKLFQQCSFHPQINYISQIIAKKLPHSYPSQRKREKDIKRIQKYLEEKQKKELAECTFQPSILRKSRSKSKSTERYKALYEESKTRQMKRKKSLQQLQISRKKSAVKINKISQFIVGDRTFFERLKQDEQKRQQKKTKIQYEIKQSQNRIPSTGRGPTNRSRNISIGEHLYSQAVKKSVEKQKQSQPLKLSKLTCKKSEQIYENTKKTSFEYIFALLDNDQDGLISNIKINLSRLPGDVLRLLAPLLIEMEDIKAQLDETQFIEALQRLFNSLSVAEKQTILNVFKFKNSPTSQYPSFKPQLNEKSLLWARQNRPEKIDLYELWRETEIQKQQRLQQIRAYKVLSELEQCTFHPVLFR